MSSSFPTTRIPAISLTRSHEIRRSPDEAVAPLPEELTDEALILSIRNEDQEALGLLFRRYCRLVWSIGQRVLRNKEEADDLLQDVFLFVRRKADAFDLSKGTVRSLLVHITYQRAISHRRYLACRNFYSSINSESETESRNLSLGAPEYHESLEAHFGREVVQRALADLSAEQRETLRLHFFLGYTLEEIAAQTGQSYGNIRHYYYRALDKLRRLLPKDPR
jgi:RNA polymerase sigma-70 factor, ECF subfamily